MLNKLWFAGMGGVELPDDEGRRFLFMVISLGRLWERAYNKSRGGTLESRSWSGIHQELTGVFSFPGTQEYWKRIQFMFPPDFVDFAENAIRKVEAARSAA